MHALRWGIKKSLHEYVRSAEGSIEVADGARLDGDEVIFPADDGVEGAFTGSVRFLAHGGMMDWRLAAPHLEDGGSIVTIGGRRGARVQFASVEAGEVSLTLDGAILLGNFYAPGTALDPLRVE